MDIHTYIHTIGGNHEEDMHIILSIIVHGEVGGVQDRKKRKEHKKTGNATYINKIKGRRGRTLTFIYRYAGG